MKHIFIINPNAGKKRKEDIINQIEEVFEGTDYRIEVTTAPKEATSIAKRYAKTGIEMCIYACGGDGTLNEVVNGMYEYNNVYLGIIPIGTGNDFIKALKPEYRDYDFLQIKNYLNPSIQKCDLLDVAGHFTLNIASVGFDVKVAKNVEKFKFLSFSSNSIPYYMSLLNSLLSSLSCDYNILLDGKPLGKSAYSFVVACNGNYYGGGYCPCPNANINDGYIDVCLIHKVTRRKIMRLSHAYKKGEHIQFTDLVEIHRVKKIQILCDDNVLLNVDGEIIKRVNPEIHILNHKINLLLPNKS